MKCGAWIREKKTKKGKVFFKMEYAGWLSDNEKVLRTFGVEDGGLVRCDGDVSVASVEVIDEADWGCTRGELRITYCCSKCDCTIYPELPSRPEDLLRLLNGLLPSMDGGVLRVEFRDRELERAKKWDEMKTEVAKRREEKK